MTSPAASEKLTPFRRGAILISTMFTVTLYLTTVLVVSTVLPQIQVAMSATADVWLLPEELGLFGCNEVLLQSARTQPRRDSGTISFSLSEIKRQTFTHGGRGSGIPAPLLGSGIAHALAHSHQRFGLEAIECVHVEIGQDTELFGSEAV